MNRFLKHVSAGVLLVCVCATAGHAAALSQDRLSLDGEWRFKLAPDAAAARQLEDFSAEGFDASSFEPIPVPSNWTTHGFEEPHFVNGTSSEGFYLHTFDVPASQQGRRALLHFGGVWQSAEVWLTIGRPPTTTRWRPRRAGRW